MKNLLLAIAACLVITPSFSQTVNKDCIDGKINVRFQPWAIKQVYGENPNNLPIKKLTTLTKILNKYGVTKAYKPFYQASDDAILPNIVTFEFKQKTSVNSFIHDISEVYGVVYAEKVPLMETSITPNDPSYGSQTQFPQINAPNAWNIFNGNSNITVAIVDNAVKRNHPDLQANTYTNVAEAGGVAGVDDDNNGYIDDINGYDVADNDNNTIPTNNAQDHGTHCAGISGAVTNNGVGISSIGWNLKIIPVKCSADGSPVTQIDNGYGGIIYAAKAGAKVISCSWGGNTGGQAGQDVVNYAWSKGCIIIAAAGNANVNTPNYPGAYNNVYCVASCGSTNIKSSFSNYGQVGNAWVDIIAPGENIYSTLPNNGYGNMSGTSMATPLVAGLAGMILSVAPLMTQTAVLNCISTTAVNIYTIGANATYSTGLRLGAGRIEANAAMTCAQGYLLAPPIANFFSLVRNTCPNTPLTFQDSSLYLYTPASWSWTFQAGTPATSTSSMPVVQWASPGTYSVAMKVTTPNGNNTMTKISYITVTNPIALPLNEGFQPVTFLPTNWTPFNIGNDNIYWTRTTSCGGFGTSTACALFDNAGLDAGGDRDEMRTPRYIFSNVVSARLRFDVAYKFLDNTYTDTLKVKLSTNCGTSWTNIYSKGGTVLATAAGTQIPLFVPLSNEWRRDSVDITALTAGQGNVMMSFVNHGHYGQGVYLDNINLFFPAPTTTFVVPPPVCAGSSVTYTNSTTGASTYTWAFQGGSPATSTATNPVVTYSAGGIFTTTLTAQNGTTTSSITKTISINGTPPVAVNNQTICSGGTATLNATGAQTYTWSTGFIGNPLLVSPPTNTVYSVTGTSLGCVGSTTVSVTIGSMLSVYITPTSPTLCAFGANTLTASGATSYTWSTGPVTTSIAITPSTTTTYSIIGTNGACSGTTALTVSVIPTPTMGISFSPSPSVCLGQTATLTANGNYTAFTWMTPTVVANSITVSPGATTNYTVLANGTGGCSTSTVFPVTIKTLPSAVITTTDASCAGCPDGEAMVTVTAGVAPYTYQWLPVGGTQSFVSGFNPGCYSVNITSANGCVTQQTMCINVNVTTGFNPVGANGINSLLIYPNPAKNFIMVDYQGKHFNFALYNSIGQLIIEKNNNNNLAFIQLDDLASGLYTIVVEQNNEKVRKKLVIE